MALPKVVIDSAIWVTPSLSALPIELVPIRGTQIVPSDLEDANALITRTVTRIDANLLQDSPISFPMEGYTLALDFPVNARTLKLLDRLDAVTVDHGGRFYLAKDSRMSADTLHRSDPRMADFAAMRVQTGLSEPLRSAQAERLSL